MTWTSNGNVPELLTDHRNDGTEGILGKLLSNWCFYREGIKKESNYVSNSCEVEIGLNYVNHVVNKIWKLLGDE